MLRELGISGRIMWGLLRQFVSAVAVPQFLFYAALRHGTLAAALGAAGGWTAALQVDALIRVASSCSSLTPSIRGRRI